MIFLIFFIKKIRETSDEFVEKMEEDFANEIYYTKKLKEIDSHVEFLKMFNKFYFKTGRFPGNHFDLMMVPPGAKPSFVKTRDEISASEINEKFQSGPSYGLAAVQFLAALNIYFGDDKKLSQNVMSEFFHNMSLQALTIDEDNVKIEFDAVIKLNENLKSLIRDDNRNEINIIDFKQQKLNEIKDKNQLIEEEVVNNIVNDVQLDYPQDNENLSFPNSASEIFKETEASNITDNKTLAAFNARDEEISQELITTARNDLIKSVTDAEGEIPTEVFNNITSSLELQEESKSEKDVRKHIQTTIKKNNEQYLEKNKEKKPISEEAQQSSAESIKLTNILTDQTGVVRRSKRLNDKKPYDKNK